MHTPSLVHTENIPQLLVNTFVTCFQNQEIVEQTRKSIENWASRPGKCVLMVGRYGQTIFRPQRNVPRLRVRFALKPGNCWINQENWASGPGKCMLMVGSYAQTISYPHRKCYVPFLPRPAVHLLLFKYNTLPHYTNSSYKSRAPLSEFLQSQDLTATSWTFH